MCKQENGFCPYLPEDAWPTRSPLTPLGWFNSSIDSFVAAFNSVSAGDPRAAIQHLAETRSSELQEWMHVHAQNAGFWRARGAAVRKGIQQRQRIPATLERELFERDGYHCRYCELRVIPQSVFKRVNQALGDAHFRITGGNLQRHGIKMCFSATLDHVVPLSLDGPNDASNLVTSCWACNYGKAAYSLKQLGMQDPRDFAPITSDWHGLV